MTTELIANSPTPGLPNAITTLAAAITTTGALTITTAGAAPAALQGAGQFRIVIDNEIMIVTAGATGTSWTVTRGAEGSTAATHLIGASVFHYLTAGALQNLVTGGSGSSFSAPSEPGSLGATQTINFGSPSAPIWKDLIGPLSANLTVLATSYASAPGCRGMVIVQQPASGGPFTLSMDDGSGPQTANIATAANAISFVYFVLDGSNEWFQVLGASGLLPASNLSDVADVDTSRFNLRVPVLRECKAAATANVASLSGTTTIDTVALSAGDRVLLTAQTTGSQNGPWLVQAGAWTRPNDYPTGGTLTSRLAPVSGGSTANQGVWQLKSTATITVGTTATTWASVSGGSIASASDASVSGPTDQQGLIYNSALSKWQNQAQKRGWRQGLGDGGFRRRNQGLPIIDMHGSGLSSRNHRGFWLDGTHYIVSDTGTNLGGSSILPDLYLYTGTSLDAAFASQGSIVNVSAFTSLNARYNTLVGTAIHPDGAGGYQMYVPVTDGYYGTLPTQADTYRMTATSPAGPWTLASTTPAIPMLKSGSSTLSAPTGTTAITSLAINALTGSIPSGGKVIVTDGATHTDVFTASATANAGAASVSVTSQAPSFNYLAGASVYYGFGPVDPSPPVLWRGTWYLAAEWYPMGGGTHTTEIWSGPSAQGPWTKITHLTSLNALGQLDNVDAPQLISTDGRLFLMTNPDGWGIYLWEIDPTVTNAYFIGVILNTISGDSLEGKNSQWGGGSIYQAGDELVMCWQGMGSDNQYWKGFVASWQPGIIYVNSDSNGFSLANGTAVTTSRQSLTLPSWLPPSCIAVDLYIEAIESATFTAGEYVTLDNGFGATKIKVFPQALNQRASARGRVDLFAQAPKVGMVAAGTPGTLTAYVAITGYWRLP